jgi:hypothetical protein
MMRITGTFLDEITHDLPSNNWGRGEWARDFEIMKAVGIDTVILIRAGYKNEATFDSAVLKREVGIMPVYTDLVEMFLDLAEENGMDFYFGTYDSGKYWKGGDAKREIEIAKPFVDEAFERYGGRKAFRGWYLTYEIGARNEAAVECLEKVGKHCKQIKDMPVLISPYFQGCKMFDNPITLEEHKRNWDEILGRVEGVVDIVAFQDGIVSFEELGDFMQVNTELIKKHGMRAWSNVENFSRDMPFDFPPIDWRKLWWKMSDAEKKGVEKIITFEFSHFMSPQSCWPAAGNLFARYCEHFGIDCRHI